MSAARVWLALALAVLAVAGCSKKPVTGSADAATEQKAAAERAREGPYGTQLKALDQAKSLQADLDKKAQEEGERADAMSK